MLRSFFLALVLLAVGACPAFAHPHVWISYKVTALGDEKGVSGLRFVWEVDPMFTEMVKGDFHLKTITEKDSAFIKTHAFDNLHKFHYYMDIKIDGKPFVPQLGDVTDFHAREIPDKEPTLEYTFTLKLPKPTKDLAFSLYDPTFYVDIEPPMQEIGADHPGIMASASYKPKEFVAVDGAAKGTTCSAKEGHPREGAWGTFPVFIVTCH